MDPVAHLQPVSKFDTESPGTGDRFLGLEVMFSFVSQA